MTQNDEDDIGAQVSSRLEELFGEEDDEESAEWGTGSVQGPAKSGQKGSAEQPGSEDGLSDIGEDGPDSPLKHLKALVFGIDWEITDDGMRAFLDEIARLRAQYQHDKILHTFLKLHESVGKYIKAKKARANPEAFKFVQSVFKSFEKVIDSRDMPQSRRKRLLSEQIKNFKDFKEKLAAAKKAEKQRAMVAQEQKAEEKPPETPEIFQEEPAREEKELFEVGEIRPEEKVIPEQEPRETPEEWKGKEEPVQAGQEMFETEEEPIELETEPGPAEATKPAEEEEPIELETEPGPAEAAKPAEEDRIAGLFENQEVVDYIVAELKKTIREEFNTIRQIIKNLGA
ncbi:MAG: hypothetical protein ACOC8I_00535 [Desulfosalsimonas sp.]